MGPVTMETERCRWMEAPLLGRGTWVWPSKFLTFLSFGSWLIPSSASPRRKSQRLASYPDQTASIFHPAQGRRGRSRAPQTACIFQKPQHVGHDPQAGAGTGFWRVHRYLPFTGVKLMQFRQSGEIVKLLTILRIFHTVSGKTGDLGDFSVHFFFFKRKENC